jgi:hypothetical protein
MSTPGSVADLEALLARLDDAATEVTGQTLGPRPRYDRRPAR